MTDKLKIRREFTDLQILYPYVFGSLPKTICNNNCCLLVKGKRIPINGKGHCNSVSAEMN